ncbi:23S rRNA (pseudouridine(1915)-N(3))-methyltransferase RlmH [Chthonobacter rhizosphaerae]|uniref:23S rRNA (pseudouridine(1915)-N(3))-methyltransferase RlmH n=1 Tax=Chthonobacter rhizosphaerae TaxID=2735553 RepID=UPI0015EFADC1|nr:23S rRNA (pseudouridine(1915)-N(3))-methyltransferase RlmH [Chthonobacter rhizosphaerae]
MRIAIHAVGRLKAGPERELTDRYLDRAAKSGRAIGITAVASREIAESRAARAEARKDEEAAALLADLPDGAVTIALDEGGETIDSARFAALVGSARDRSVPALVLLIGGADGHGPALLARASLKVAFGRLTFPHQIVRILAAEQVYRAITILSGHPYHRS